MKRSRLPSPITEARADPADPWVAALVLPFVPDPLEPLERTASMHQAKEAERGRTITLSLAADELRRAYDAGNLSRRWVRLKPRHRGEYVYQPKVK
jgi:hypothetical protein